MSDGHLHWLPAPEDRIDGFECLAFHRGKWRHVRWDRDLRRWSLGFRAPFILEGEREFAPLPENTPDRKNGNGFFDWRG